MEDRMPTRDGRMERILMTIAVAIFSCACGRSKEAERIEGLETRLSALEDRIEETKGERAGGCSILSAATAMETVETAPALSAGGVGYLDGTGMSFGASFDWRTRRVLAEGAASISGKVTADGRARAGIKLRLFLSGIRSAWATSDASGRYVVRVPPGKYSYQGFELDPVIADSELPGMLLRGERGCPRAHPVEASAERPGEGPDFRFVTAVSPISPSGRSTVSREKVRLSWKAYPGATDYGVMLLESDRDGMGGRPLSMNNPSFRTVETSLLVPDRIRLTPGKLYLWTVTAYDAEGDEISHSPQMSEQAAFEVE